MRREALPPHVGRSGRGCACRGAAPRRRSAESRTAGPNTLLSPAVRGTATRRRGSRAGRRGLCERRPQPASAQVPGTRTHGLRCPILRLCEPSRLRQAARLRRVRAPWRPVPGNRRVLRMRGAAARQARPRRCRAGCATMRIREMRSTSSSRFWQNLPLP